MKLVFFFMLVIYLVNDGGCKTVDPVSEAQSGQNYEGQVDPVHEAEMDPIPKSTDDQFFEVFVEPVIKEQSGQNYEGQVDPDLEAEMDPIPKSTDDQFFLDRVLKGQSVKIPKDPVDPNSKSTDDQNSDALVYSLTENLPILRDPIVPISEALVDPVPEAITYEPYDERSILYQNNIPSKKKSLLEHILLNSKPIQILRRLNSVEYNIDSDNLKYQNYGNPNAAESFVKLSINSIDQIHSHKGGPWQRYGSYEDPAAYEDVYSDNHYGNYQNHGYAAYPSRRYGSYEDPAAYEDVYADNHYGNYQNHGYPVPDGSFINSRNQIDSYNRRGMQINYPWEIYVSH